MSENSMPLLPVTVKAKGTITARRLIGFDDLQITVAGAAAKGVSRDAAVLNDVISVTVLGTEVIESGGAFVAGDDLISDSSGRAVKAAALSVNSGAGGGNTTLTGSSLTEKRIGIAFEAATGAGDFVEVLLTK